MHIYILIDPDFSCDTALGQGRGPVPRADGRGDGDECGTVGLIPARGAPFESAITKEIALCVGGVEGQEKGDCHRGKAREDDKCQDAAPLVNLTTIALPDSVVAIHGKPPCKVILPCAGQAGKVR